MPEDERITLREVISATEVETRARLTRGEYPGDLVRQLATPLEGPPEEAPEALAFVPSARPLRAGTALGQAGVLTKRIVRRLLAWYVNPITVDQSRFNEATIQLIRRLERRVERLEAPWRPAPGGPEPEAPLSQARRRLLRTLAAHGSSVLLLGDVGELGDGTSAQLVPVEGDPIACLQRIEPGSLDGVYLAAVVPRLSAGDLLDIVPCATDRLVPGGWLVADAPDAAGGEPPVADPRFQRRVTSETVALLFEAAGLRGTETLPLSDPGAAGWFAVVGRRA